MKKAISIIVIAIGLYSCNQDSINEKNFMDTYQDILVVRNSITDTTLANKIIDSIMKAHNYSMESFQVDMLKLAKNKDDFNKVIDSMRSNLNTNKIKNFIQKNLDRNIKPDSNSTK